MPKRDRHQGRGESLEALRRELKRCPNTARPLFRLTRLLLEQRNREAQQWLPELERFPDYAEGWNELGQTLVRLGRPQAALTCFQRALAAHQPPLAARLGAANCYLAQQEPQHAIDCLAAAAGQAADDPRLLGLLGKAHYTRGDRDTAESTLLAAVAAQPDDAGSWYRLGLVRHDRGQYAAAAEAYAQALGSGGGPFGREAAFNRGVALQACGQREAAVAAYREAVRLDPDCAMRAIQALSSSASGLLWLDMTAARRFLGTE